MSSAIGIVGMGGMGRGIAEVAAQSGYRVVLVKATAGSEMTGRQAIADSFARSVKRGKISDSDAQAALERITFTNELSALADCELVIESVIEDLQVKCDLFCELEKIVGPTCVLASNTSALPLSSLAEVLKRPQRFVGLHFFSPVPAMKLVELASTHRTYPTAVEYAQRFIETIGKTPVMVSETSGYIVNRLLVPFILDGIAALDARLAPAASIDLAMKLGCGHPMGPLALADAIGLDIVYAMARTLYKELSDRRFSPPPLLRRLVLNGHLGKKSRLGIYDYSVEPPAQNSDLWLKDSEALRADA